MACIVCVTSGAIFDDTEDTSVIGELVVGGAILADIAGRTGVTALNITLYAISISIEGVAVFADSADVVGLARDAVTDIAFGGCARVIAA